MSGETPRGTRMPVGLASAARVSPFPRASRLLAAPLPRTRAESDPRPRPVRFRTRPAAGWRHRLARMTAAGLAPLMLASCGAVLQDPPVDPQALKKKPPRVNAPYGFEPLTGRPAADAKTAKRPALAVALRLGRRVTGLEAADLVYHEVGSGRLVALYQSKLPKRAGPVAEARPFDAKILPVTGAIVATAGGPDKFVRQLTKAEGITSITAPRFKAGFRGGYAYPERILKRAGGKAKTPPKIIQYANPGQELSPRSGPAKRLTVEIQGQQDEIWNYDAKAKLWRREGRPEFAAANVIVQIARFKRTPIKQAGVTVPTVRPYGKGIATVAAASEKGGQSAVGTWRKPGTYQAIIYGTGRARPMLFTPGPTWVIIAPIGSRALVE